jgi:hypothetical protein
MLLLIAIFVFYGLRWFQGTTLKGSTGTGQAWPPIVNLCPDFMVGAPGTDSAGNKRVYCVDINDIYGLKTSLEVANYMTSATLGPSIAGQNYSGLIMLRNEKTSTRLTDDFSKAVTERRWPVLSGLKANLAGFLAQKDKFKNIRWEGVYDGLSATPDKAPLPTV